MFGNQVLAFKLALFPVATCQLLRSLAGKYAKLYETILLPLETRKVAHDQVQNFVTKSLLHLTQLIINLFNLYVKIQTCFSKSAMLYLFFPFVFFFAVSTVSQSFSEWFTSATTLSSEESPVLKITCFAMLFNIWFLVKVKGKTVLLSNVILKDYSTLCLGTLYANRMKDFQGWFQMHRA